MNKGMCPALNDRDYFMLMTENGTKNLNLIVKYYPELSIYIKHIN